MTEREWKELDTLHDVADFLADIVTLSRNGQITDWRQCMELANKVIRLVRGNR